MAKVSNSIPLLLALIAFSSSLFAQTPPLPEGQVLTHEDVAEGAERLELYLPVIKDKRVAIVANQTSLVDGVHLVDTLLSLGVNIRRVFAPEHGFRGTADNGEKVSNSKDKKTGLAIRSLYGRNKKPSPADLRDVDVVIFDIQDVGVRFYTYIYTLSYVMEACAENGVQCIVLDRPNPNGFYVDGPVLEPSESSFVGRFPIALVHGLTVGEFSKMVNGEGWMKEGIQCELTVIPCDGYNHMDRYQLPVRPSPNLPNMHSIYLYPSLGLFEGTMVSVGRGTVAPFQMIGHPTLKGSAYTFTPKSMPGAKYPPHLGKVCKGYDLREFAIKAPEQSGRLHLQWLMGTYKNTPNKDGYFLASGFFNKLSGNRTLRDQIRQGLDEKSIVESWQPGLTAYKAMRKKYLLYPDFVE